MVVVENPSRFDGTVSYGSFVLITVDIASSIRGVTDQVAIDAAQALPRAKCLAWIRMNTSYPGSPLFYAVFLLVDRHLPAPPLSFAAVPVAPNTEHPDTGRAAVLPSRPFPWPDCYIHTLQTVTAPISRLHESPDHDIRLEGDQKKALLLACYDDADAREELENAASDSSEADDFGLPPGWRIRDHGDYGSVVYEGSGSGADADALSQRSAHIDQDGGARTASGEAPLARSSSVHGSAAETPPRGNIGDSLAADLGLEQPLADDAVLEEHAAEARIVLHVEVSGDLDASDEFGSAADFLSVVQRLAEIEDDRVDREEAARLARAVSPKTTAWLQGVSAANRLEEPVADDAPLEPLLDSGSARICDEDIVQGEPSSPCAVLPTEDQAKSAKPSPDNEMQDEPRGHEKSAAHSQAPSAAASLRSPGGSVRAPSPEPPNGVSTSVFHDHDKPSSPSRDGVEAGTAGVGRDLSADARKDLEAGPLPQPTISTTKTDTATPGGSPRPKALRALLSVLISRFRAFVAKCRALF